jgi:hypothetical protein
MELIEIDTECYSGYKADEYPKCFYRDNERYEITDVTDHWYESEQDPSVPVSCFFRVLTDIGGRYLLKHDLQTDRWYLCL